MKNTQICYCCGEEKKINCKNLSSDEFYRSNSRINSFNSGTVKTRGKSNSKDYLEFKQGYMPYCKDCVEKEYDYYLQKYNDINKAIFYTCMTFSIYYDSELAISSIEQSKNKTTKAIKIYIKNAHMIQNLGISFLDSKNIERMYLDNLSLITDKSDNVLEKSIIKNQDDLDKLQDKWGIGYSSEEYRAFEKKYDKLIDGYGEKTALHTEGLLNYIRHRVKEEIATANGDVKEAKEWGALASKDATDAKLNVSQLTKSDITGGVDVVSQLSEAVESESGIIPLLPKLITYPKDEGDLIIWAIIEYQRRLKGESRIHYKDIWGFYGQFLQDFFSQRGMKEEDIKEFMSKRDSSFNDLESIYVEPVYIDEGWSF